MSDTRQPNRNAAQGWSLPPWLQGVPLPQRPLEQVPPAATGNETVPDWLLALRSSIDVEPAPTELATSEAVPDWLGGLSGASQPAATPQAQVPEEAAGEMPDWLRELSTSLPAETSAPEPTAPPAARPAPRLEGATTWLQSMGNTPAEPPRTPDAPTTPPPAPRSRQMPSGATDWLRSLGQEPDPNAPPPRAEEPATAPTPVESGIPSAEIGIPSWLDEINIEDLERDLAETQAQDAAATTPDADPPKEDSGALPSWLMSSAGDDNERGSARADVPSWLQDVPSDEETDNTAPSWLGSLASEQAGNDDEDDAPGAMPDWLSSAVQPEPTQERVLPPAAPQEFAAPDWLNTADHNPEPAAAANDVPPWLRENASATPSETTAQSQSDLPGWLRAAEPPAAEMPANDAPAASGELPDWLRVVQEEPAEATPPVPAAPTDNAVPDWLRGAEPVASTPTPAEPDSSTLPDWLRAAEEPVAPPPTSPQITGAALPDWLQAEEQAPTVSAPAPVEPAPPASDDVPPWLQGESAPSPDRGRPGDENLPAWLRGADERVAMPPTPPPTPTSNDAATLPPWLSDVPQAAPPVSAQPASEPPARASGGDFLGGTDLPSWLRQPEEVSAVAATSVERPSDWLERLRNQDEELEAPSGDIATAAMVVPARPQFTRTPAQLEAINLLQRLVATPYPEPVTAPAPTTHTAWRRMGLERALMLLLLLAIMVGLLVPATTAPFAGPVAATSTAPLVSAIDQLSDQSRVLVAYEWDARRRAELAPLENSVLDHLASRKVKFVFMSTDMQGALLAFDARDRLINPANGYGYQTGGRDYVLLGYRPGGDFALRGLAQDLPNVLSSDFQGQDARQSAVAQDVASGQLLLNSLSDFAMIVVLADDPQDVQGWMEQVHSQARQVPILFLLPAEATPIVQPYLRQQNVSGLSGKSGAIAYDQARGGERAAAATADSGRLFFVVAVFVALVLIGALINALLGSQRKRAT